MRLLEKICWLFAAALCVLMLWKILFTKAPYADMIVLTEPHVASMATSASLWMMVPFVLVFIVGLAAYLHQKTNP
jgi:hypothetical protein